MRLEIILQATQQPTCWFQPQMTPFQETSTPSRASRVNAAFAATRTKNSETTYPETEKVTSSEEDKLSSICILGIDCGDVAENVGFDNDHSDSLVTFHAEILEIDHGVLIAF